MWVRGADSIQVITDVLAYQVAIETRRTKSCVSEATFHGFYSIRWSKPILAISSSRFCSRHFARLSFLATYSVKRVFKWLFRCITHKYSVICQECLVVITNELFGTSNGMLKGISPERLTRISTAD